jgi:hypothetical protein
MDEERCELTELLVGQCAHCLKHKSIEEQAKAHPAALAGDPRWFPAQYPGACGHCGEPFTPGMLIRSLMPREIAWLASCCAEEAL